MRRTRFGHYKGVPGLISCAGVTREVWALHGMHMKLFAVLIFAGDAQPRKFFPAEIIMRVAGIIHASQEWDQRWSLARLPSASLHILMTDPLAPAPEQRRARRGGTGATGLLHGDDEADERRARLHIWSHSRDAVSSGICRFLRNGTYFSLGRLYGLEN